MPDSTVAVFAPSAIALPRFKVSTPRRIDPELEKMIDEAVIRYFLPEFTKARDAQDYNAFVAIAGKALETYDIREKSNRNDGKLVNKIQWTTGNGTGDAWCMSTGQTLICWAEIKSGKRSLIYKSASCASVRTKTVESVKRVSVKALKAGDMVIFKYENGTGHTGTFIGYADSSTMILIEGNTTKGLVDGKLDRDGGGLYLTHRSVKGYGDAKVALCLRPF